MWKIIREMRIPDHLTCLLRNLYAGQETAVWTGHGADWFQIGKGVGQGYILSPCLFNLYAEYIMRNAGLEGAQARIKTSGRNINNLRYADDTTLMAESKEELKSLLMKVKEKSGVGEDSWESLGLQGDPTSPTTRKSVLNMHWKERCWNWNSNALATWCEELTHWKRPWCWERLKSGEEDNRGWDGWMASPTRWTWVWVSSGSWWWTGTPGVLWFIGSQRVRHDWETELSTCAHICIGCACGVCLCLCVYVYTHTALHYKKSLKTQNMRASWGNKILFQTNK